MKHNSNNQDITPDDLLNDFRGKNFFSIFILTVNVHTVLLVGTSVPWLMDRFNGGVDKEASEEVRMKDAVREATSSLREIADKHGIHPEELSSQFTKGSKPASRPVTKQSVETKPAPDTDTPTSTTPTDEPKSSIEKELEVEAKGPAVPAIPQETEEDLFK
jgi:hypothetical protein